MSICVLVDVRLDWVPSDSIIYCKWIAFKYSKEQVPLRGRGSNPLALASASILKTGVVSLLIKSLSLAMRGVSLACADHQGKRTINIHRRHIVLTTTTAAAAATGIFTYYTLLPQCRFMIQRNVYRRDSTRSGIMRMYAINSIAVIYDHDMYVDFLHSVYVADHHEVGDIFRNSVGHQMISQPYSIIGQLGITS
jgi:hypothetical protein